MSINAIAAGNSYYSSSIDAEYELIKQRLKALGLAPSGNKAADKLLLQKTEKPQQSSSTSSSLNNIMPTGAEKSQGQPPLPPGWKELMAQLGITSSGDVEIDYKKAVLVIAEKLSATSDEAEKSKYKNIQTKIERVRNEFIKSKLMSPNEMTGATALSDMNRALLVNKSS